MRKLIAVVASCGISLLPIMSTAFAAVTLVNPGVPAADPGQIELDGMQTACDAAAAVHSTGNGDIWTGEVVLGAVTWVSGPTNVGTHTIADAIGGPTWVEEGGGLTGAGTFTPGSVSILGDPYRNGGSVNMFGVQQSTGGSFSASEYNFEGEFETTYAHAFSCDIYQAVKIPGDPLGGHYTIRDDLIGTSQADAILQACNAYNEIPERPGFWGNNPQGNCKFVSEPTVDTWETAILIGNEPQTAIEVTQTDTLLAHEDAGEGFDIGQTVLIGQAVICISPSKTGPKGVPGTWQNHNGYTGDKCTTNWFNQAPWGHGSQDSNGTYISVPLA